MYLDRKNKQNNDMGDLELIHVISYMLNLRISILDFGGGTADIVTWHFGHHRSIQGIHVVLLYNRSTHSTGTGNNFLKISQRKNVILFTLYIIQHYY